MNFGAINKFITFVLKVERESEQLRLIREDKGFDLIRGISNTASRLCKKDIFAFRTTKYESVYRYSLENGEWSLFFS